MADFEFTDNSGKLKNAMDRAVEQLLYEWGLNATYHAEKYCPVKTGNLKNSITFETDTTDKAMYVGTNVEYAEEVELNEFVRHKTGGPHYLKNSIANHVDEYEKIAQRVMKSL